MMFFRHNTSNCFEDRLGPHGVSKKRVDELLARLSPSLDSLKERSFLQAAPLLAMPFCSHDLTGIETLADTIRSKYKHVIVIGSGGSGLSGRTLSGFMPEPLSLTLHFLDTIDPDATAHLLHKDILANACFLVISKSGSTAETVAQFYVFFEQAKAQLGIKAASERFILITMQGDNPLRRAAKDHGLRVLDHETDVGGRFSVLITVGLLPAAIAGMDIKALRRGQQSVVSEMEAAASPAACSAALGAALQYAFIEKGRNISVLMPYCQRLFGLSRWYRQSWAESLGKDGKGSTAICAMGTTDQHSQLQLYLDGPHDKLINLVTLKHESKGERVTVPPDTSLAYMHGKTTGDIMDAEQRATVQTLIKNKRPVRLFELDMLGEEQLGALLMHFILEIIFTSQLLEVNPFNQPAVEEGKKLAREYLAGKS